MGKKVGRDPGRTVTQEAKFYISIHTRPTQSDPIPIKWDGQVIIQKSRGSSSLSIKLDPWSTEEVVNLVLARLNLIEELLNLKPYVIKDTKCITTILRFTTNFRTFVDACYRTFCEEVHQTDEWPHHWLDWSPRNLSVEELLRNGNTLAQDIEERCRKMAYVLCLKSHRQNGAAPNRTISRRWSLDAQNDQELHDNLGNAFGVRIRSYSRSDGIVYHEVEILLGDPMSIIPEFSGWALRMDKVWDKLLKDRELILWRVD
jgi:hypothetical protein